MCLPKESPCVGPPNLQKIMPATHKLKSILKKPKTPTPQVLKAENIQDLVQDPNPTLNGERGGGRSFLNEAGMINFEEIFPNGPKWMAALWIVILLIFFGVSVKFIYFVSAVIFTAFVYKNALYQIKISAGRIKNKLIKLLQEEYGILFGKRPCVKKFDIKLNEDTFKYDGIDELFYRNGKKVIDYTPPYDVRCPSQVNVIIHNQENNDDETCDNKSHFLSILKRFYELLRAKIIRDDLLHRVHEADSSGRVEHLVHWLVDFPFEPP